MRFPGALPLAPPSQPSLPAPLHPELPAPNTSPAQPRPGPSRCRPWAAGSGACSGSCGRRGAVARLRPDRSGPRSSLALRLRSGCERPPCPRPALSRRAPRARRSSSAPGGRTEAASSAAGCGADPGDEMTTSTLQVSRCGGARLPEAGGGAAGPASQQSGGRPARNPGPVALSPPPCRRLHPFLFSCAQSHGPSPVQNSRAPATPTPRPARPSPEAAPCSQRRPSTAAGISLLRTAQAPPGKLGPAVGLLALPPPASLRTSPRTFPRLGFPPFGPRPFIHSSGLG